MGALNGKESTAEAKPEEKINNLDDSDTDTLIDDVDESTEVQDAKDSLRSRTIALDYISLIADLTHILVDAKDE